MPSSPELEARVEKYLLDNDIASPDQLGHQLTKDLVALVRACAAPEWTRKSPTTPGPYWVIPARLFGKTNLLTWPRVWSVENCPYECCELWVPGKWSDDDERPLYWCGPLPPPPSPREEDGE